MNADGENPREENSGSYSRPVPEQVADDGNPALPRPAASTPGWPHTRRSARLEAVGMTVTRTPFKARSMTSAGLPVAISAWNRWQGNSRVASTSSSVVFRSESRIPVVCEHLAIHPPRGQQFGQLARTQRRTAGGVQVTVDRGEKQAHGAEASSRLRKASPVEPFGQAGRVSLFPSSCVKLIVYSPWRIPWPS